MARGGRTRRWIAAAGGVLINGLILAALVLVEPAPPVMEEPPIMVLELERHAKQRPPRARPAARAAATSSRPNAEAAAPSASPAVDGEVAAPPAPVAPPPVEPAWRVDPRAVDRWRLTEGVPEWGWGRYYRACKGLSSEHMTDEEKDRCYGGAPRPPRKAIGPVDRREIRTYQPDRRPPSRYDKDAQRQERCRDYRRGRTPGFSERNLASTGSPPPGLRERGCF